MDTWTGVHVTGFSVYKCGQALVPCDIESDYDYFIHLSCGRDKNLISIVPTFQYWLLLLVLKKCPLTAGSPKYFSPILHYLRTNNLEIPSGVNRQSLQLEAEYYGIQKIVDHLKHLEAEKQKAESVDKSEWGGPKSIIEKCVLSL